MKTLLVSEVFPPQTGGTGRWFWEIYRRLPRAEYLIAAGEDPRQEAFDRGHNLRVQRVPLAMSAWGLRSRAGLSGYWRAVRRLRRLARGEGVRMLHCGRCLPEGFMARLIKVWDRTPYLCYVHGEEMNYAASSRELCWMMKWVLGAADFLIANSRNTERILREGWGLPADRVRVLHPGVDTRRFVPSPRDPQVRARLGWGDRPVLLSVGRLQKRKGHDQVIRALPAIRRAVPDVLFAIVGDGEEREALMRLVAEHEGLGRSVQFLGELADEQMIQCYQQCDLFVLANRQVGQDIEGFGIVLLEAQACGKPVLAGASGGTAETMSIPDTGRVVPCEGPEELAAAVSELLADPLRLERMGRAARLRIVEQFDWAVLSRKAEQLFRRQPVAGAGPRKATTAPATATALSR
jgi:phosphatidylinositol alpha-1,6-mannosyltransferase